MCAPRSRGRVQDGLADSPQTECERLAWSMRGQSCRVTPSSMLSSPLSTLILSRETLLMWWRSITSPTVVVGHST